MDGGGVYGFLGGLRVETCGQTVLFVDGIRCLWTGKLKIIKHGYLLCINGKT